MRQPRLIRIIDPYRFGSTFLSDPVRVERTSGIWRFID